MGRDQIVPQKTGLWLSHRQAIGRQDFVLEQTEMRVVSWHYCLFALLCVASSIAAPSRTRPSIFLNLSATCTIITKNPKSINRLNFLPKLTVPYHYAWEQEILQLVLERLKLDYLSARKRLSLSSLSHLKAAHLVWAISLGSPSSWWRDSRAWFTAS